MAAVSAHPGNIQDIAYMDGEVERPNKAVKSVKHVTMDERVEKTEVESRERAFNKEEKPRERRIQQLRRKRSGSGYSAASSSEDGRRARSGSQYSEEGSIYSETGE